jgi:hypothetical protein
MDKKSQTLIMKAVIQISKKHISILENDALHARIKYSAIPSHLGASIKRFGVQSILSVIFSASAMGSVALSFLNVDPDIRDKINREYNKIIGGSVPLPEKKSRKLIFFLVMLIIALGVIAIEIKIFSTYYKYVSVETKNTMYVAKVLKKNKIYIRKTGENFNYILKINHNENSWELFDKSKENVLIFQSKTGFSEEAEQLSDPDYLFNSKRLKIINSVNVNIPPFTKSQVDSDLIYFAQTMVYLHSKMTHFKMKSWLNQLGFHNHMWKFLSIGSLAAIIGNIYLNFFKEHAKKQMPPLNLN